MFEIGQLYLIKMDHGDGITEYPNCEVVEIEGTLVKFVQHGNEKIVNTASNRFIGAEPQK